MERLLLYWDDLDDLVGAARLYWERIRRTLLFILAATTVLLSLAGLVLLAFVEPPLAMAVATLMLVTLMYHSVTSPKFRQHRS